MKYQVVSVATNQSEIFKTFIKKSRELGLHFRWYVNWFQIICTMYYYNKKKRLWGKGRHVR